MNGVFYRGVNYLHREASLFRSFKTNRKIVVFESDDWGSMSVPSKEVYDRMILNGIHMEKSQYSKYDTLESSEDLNFLYEVLASTKDINGNPCIMTLNFLMANPDYQAIRKSGYNKYCYEPISETYNKYQCGDVIGTVLEGISEGMVLPQLHGREHLNVPLWLRYLRDDFDPIKEAFSLNMFAVVNSTLEVPMESVKRSLFPKNKEEFVFNEGQIKDAQEFFKKIWGFNSDSFIAPNYAWHPLHEDTFSSIGIKYLQGGYKQQYCDFRTGKSKVKYHYTGEKLRNGLLCSVRNIEFEPSSNINKSYVNETMANISSIFKRKRPCIISTHRVNFCGGLSLANRDNSLRQLQQLLKEIVKWYPDTEYMSSVDFFKFMTREKY